MWYQGRIVHGFVWFCYITRMKPLVLLLLISQSLLAQDRVSLFRKLDSVSADTMKVQYLEKIAQSYMKEDIDSAKIFARRGVGLAVKSNYQMGAMAMWNLVGIAHFWRSEYDSATLYFNKTYQIALELDNRKVQGVLLNNLGLIYNYQADYDTAALLLSQARRIREEINDPALASTLNNLGVVYNGLNYLDESLHYYKQSAALKESNNQRRSLSNTYNNIGIILKKQEKYDSALVYYQKALKLAVEFNDKPKESNAQNNLAILWNKVDSTQVDKITGHYQRSIELKRALGYNVALFNSLNNYASFLSDHGRHSAALAAIEEAAAIQEKIGENLHTYKHYLAKSSVLEGIGRYSEAIEAMRSALDVRFQEISKDHNEKIVEMEKKYEVSKKEAEIVRLSLENQLVTSALETTRLVQFTIGSTLLLFIIFLTVYFRQRSRKMETEKKAQSLQLEAMQKRFIELHASPADLAVALDYGQLNEKLYTPLTEREFEALKLSIEGKTNAEISDVLHISVSTVKFHLRNTFSKMGVKNRKEAFRNVLNAV